MAIRLCAVKSNANFTAMHTTPHDILLEARELEVYDKLLEQLRKDITRAGLQQEFDLGYRPMVVSRNLIAQIYALIITDFERYLNLLYIIDVSETTIKNLDVQQVDEMAQAISMLILRRELTKVSFKSR